MTVDQQSLVDSATKGVIAGVVERARSPLLGSFLLAWPIYNWKFLLTLFSQSLDTKEKIAQLSLLLQEPRYILVPAIISLIYFLIAPWANLVQQWYAERPERQAKLRARTIKDEDRAYEQATLEAELLLLLDRRRKAEVEREVESLRQQLITFSDRVEEDIRVRIKRTREWITEEVETIHKNSEVRWKELESEASVKRIEIQVDIEKRLSEYGLKLRELSEESAFHSMLATVARVKAEISGIDRKHIDNRIPNEEYLATCQLVLKSAKKQLEEEKERIIAEIASRTTKPI
jgi:hypothetical protein